MNPFEQANLSPLSRSPVACDLPYGLTWQVLHPFLPDFDPLEHHKAQAFSSHDKQGLNGGENSCILTLTYPTGKHTQRTETVFIKHNAYPKNAEAQKYRFLASQDVPTPHLLAAFQTSDSETILLEFLPTIGIDFHSASEVDDFLRLVAKINSMPPLPKLFDPLPGMPQADFDNLIRVALTDMAQEMPERKIDASRWFDAYKLSHQAVQTMPRAINHNEMNFQQVGWAHHGDSRQLVIFDLETMSLTPRFNDIANILYPLSRYTNQHQTDLFHRYLDQLYRFTQVELPRNEAFQELQFTRILGYFESIPWLVGEVKQTDDMAIHESLTMLVNCLSDDLIDLGLL